MTKKDLAEIRARCEAATDGPWRSLGNTMYDRDFEPHPFVTGPNDENAICRMDGDWNNDKANAAFIAHARADILELLNEVERLQARITTLLDDPDVKIDWTRGIHDRLRAAE